MYEQDSRKAPPASRATPEPDRASHGSHPVDGAAPSPRTSPATGQSVDDSLPASAAAFELVVGESQDVLHTRSRRSQPAAWRRAVRWLVSARLHPKACETTVRVADDLARRMDYVRGIAVYDLQGTASRLRVSQATVKRHVAVLRELGALVWLIHGSKRNLRMPGQPYTATATIYGAVIPPVYDEARGHRLSGTGYEARVVGVTQAGRELAVGEAARAASPVENPSQTAVDNSPSSACSSGRAPHSLACTGIRGKAEVSGGLKDTPRSRARPSTTTSPSASTPQKLAGRRRAPRRSPRQAAQDILIARQVRARVNWTQGERLRRLAFVLRPWVDAGHSVEDITSELHSWYLTWRPQKPGTYIAVQIARQAATPPPALQPEEPAGEGARPEHNTAWMAWLNSRYTAPAAADDEEGLPMLDIEDDPAELEDLRLQALEEYRVLCFDTVRAAMATCKDLARQMYGALVDEAEKDAQRRGLEVFAG